MHYSVYSFTPSYSDAGLVGLYAGCSPAKAGQVAELMVSEFRRLAKDGITDDELRRALGQLGGALGARARGLGHPDVAPRSQ